MVPHAEFALVLAPHVEVQSDGERRIIAAHGDCLARGTARYHEARRGDHAIPVTVDDTSIDAVGGSKIVSIEDNVFFPTARHHAPPTSANRARAIFCASKCSSAMARAARQCRS